MPKVKVGIPSIMDGIISGEKAETHPQSTGAGFNQKYYHISQFSRTGSLPPITLQH